MNIKTTTCAPWGGVITVVAALVGCGGSDGAPPDQVKLGEVLTFSALAKDGSPLERHYLVHGVSATGDLKTSEENGLLPEQLVALPLASAQVPDNTPQLAMLRDFYKQLWQAIASHRKPGADIALEIDAYQTDIGALHADFQRSGFASVADYVGFYEQVDKNPFFEGQELLEEELLTFFYQTGWVQSAWLQSLRNRQWDWPRFLDLMAQRQQTFADLLAQYEALRQGGPVSIDDFVSRYVASATASLQQKSLRPKSTGTPLFYLTKQKLTFSVNVDIKSSTAIISGQDKNVNNYTTLSSQESCRTAFTVKGSLGKAKADIEYSINMSEARNSALSGTWVSALNVSRVRATVNKDGQGLIGNTILSPWFVATLDGSLEVKNITNIGTPTNPRPKFILAVNMGPAGIFNTNWTTEYEISTSSQTGDDKNYKCEITNRYDVRGNIDDRI